MCFSLVCLTNEAPGGSRNRASFSVIVIRSDWCCCLVWGLLSCVPLYIGSSATVQASCAYTVARPAFFSFSLCPNSAVSWHWAAVFLCGMVRSLVDWTSWTKTVVTRMWVEQRVVSSALVSWTFIADVRYDLHGVSFVYFDCSHLWRKTKWTDLLASCLALRHDSDIVSIHRCVSVYAWHTLMHIKIN